MLPWRGILEDFLVEVSLQAQAGSVHGPQLGAVGGCQTNVFVGW